LIDQNNNDKSASIPLERVRDDLYVTKPITFPIGKFKIVADGLDAKKQKIVLVSPSTFQTVDPSN
jgi:hypothetical protein